MTQLPAEWDRGTSEVRQALTAPVPAMAAAIQGATDLLLRLIERAPNIALSQVVRQTGAGVEHYGISHSVHAAIACQAAARYLGWHVDEQRRAFQAALTMNLGMIDLQARLATQVSPLTAKQRETIKEHPTRSAEMLTEAGIADESWLNAVRHHHEVADGSGYPSGSTACTELSEMLRFADIYTARLSSRANRPGMSALQAGRGLHKIAAESPLSAALIKAFGIFPPGSVVRLASGEMGVVTRNGEKTYHPMVAALTDAAGAARPAPLLRNSAREEHGVVAVLSAQAMPVRLTDVRIASLIGFASSGPADRNLQSCHSAA